MYRYWKSFRLHQMAAHLKGNQLEAQRLSRMIKRVADPIQKNEIWTRKRMLARSTRSLALAYAFLRGREYVQLESDAKLKPLFQEIATYVEAYEDKGSYVAEKLAEELMAVHLNFKADISTGIYDVLMLWIDHDEELSKMIVDCIIETEKKRRGLGIKKFSFKDTIVRWFNDPALNKNTVFWYVAHDHKLDNFNVFTAAIFDAIMKHAPEAYEELAKE